MRETPRSLGLVETKPNTFCMLYFKCNVCIKRLKRVICQKYNKYKNCIQFTEFTRTLCNLKHISFFLSLFLKVHSMNLNERFTLFIHNFIPIHNLLSALSRNFFSIFLGERGSHKQTRQNNQCQTPWWQFFFIMF